MTPTRPFDELLAATRCPICQAQLVVVASVIDLEQGTKTGELHCRRCGSRAATLDRWHLDFRHPQPLGIDQVRVTEPITVGPLHERRFPAAQLEASVGATVPQGNDHFDDAVLLTDGASAQATSRCTDALVRLVRHPWGGVAELLVDGSLVRTIDLAAEAGAFVVGVPVVTDAEPAERRITVRALGSGQVLVDSMVLLAPAGTSGFAPPAIINLGNPRSPVIDERVAMLTPGSWVLECGGGDRRIPDPRWVNFEYQPFELADVYGDVHQLPFADDTFDIVVSQAVFEHLRQPFVAADEMQRVCRPGGLIVAEAAFLQPLHGAPGHYFNITSSGLRELFSGAEVVSEGCNGGFAPLLQWLVEATGVGTDRPVESRQLLELARGLDRYLRSEQIATIANTVHITVRALT
jgi:SAM-dependent methyltransferase